MILRIDHVSLAVRDYNKAKKFFTELLNLIPGAAGKDDKSGFFWQLFSAGDLSRFELISPIAENSFLKGFLNNREGGVHHITFQVADIKKTAKQLEDLNIPFFGLNDLYSNWKELFIHPRDAFGLLIQFAEFNAADWLEPTQNIHDNNKWDVYNKGNRVFIEFSHPGGGKVQNELNAEELDILISQLTDLRKKI